MAFSEPQKLSPEDLSFDYKNPRLIEYDLTSKSTETEILEVLWEAMDVRELVLSIGASGFFQHEPLIVTHEDARNVVIEGNRRLAAVKILLNPKILNTDLTGLPQIGAIEREGLKELPIITGTRRDAWRYIGFKHVNGPAKWGSYAKSEYITRVHQEYKIPLDEIAQQIGDTHKTVQRLFRGMMVVNQAEEWHVFSRDDRWRNHFSFSHLYTGLDYPGISSFLGLRSASEEDQQPVPQARKDELRELCLWLYGSKREDIRPVIESQNPDLRQLNAVLANRPALSALRDRRDLVYAFEVSRPPLNVFEESLYSSKRSLEKARGLLSTAYDGSRQLLSVAADVSELANDLYEDMERKNRPNIRRRPAERE